MYCRPLNGRNSALLVTKFYLKFLVTEHSVPLCNSKGLTQMSNRNKVLGLRPSTTRHVVEGAFTQDFASEKTKNYVQDE